MALLKVLVFGVVLGSAFGAGLIAVAELWQSRPDDRVIGCALGLSVASAGFIGLALDVGALL